MDNHEPVDAHDAIPVREPEAPYAGRSGRTRFDLVHVPDAEGALRSVEVCRALDVQTHPELKARALAGLLHRLDDGRELALSFVYHDPEARKLVLVVPSALAHQQLEEHARLLAAIASDTQHPVPAYVKELTTVVGTAALAQFLEMQAEPDATLPAAISGRQPAHGVELQEREHRLEQRERELQEQERALMRMAEGLAGRETELNRLKQRLDALRDDLEVREAELRDAADDGSDTAEARSWQDVGSAEPPRRVANDAAYEGPIAYGGSSFSHPPPLPQARPRSRPPPLPLRPRRVAARRESDEPRPRLRSYPPPLPLHDALVTEPHDPEPEVAAPESFQHQRHGQMAYTLAEDELWLFVRLDEAHASAFRHGAELTLQYTNVEGYPVLVLGLADQAAEPYVIRLLLDGRDGEHLRVLEHLSRSYRARIALYVESLYIETVTVATLREGVAQAIRAEIAKLPERSQLSAAEALARVQHAPPPLWNDDLPFGPVRREAPTIVTVLAAVDQLAAWLRPDKLAEATLTYSVPRHVIDATIRRVVRAAIAFGVALPDELLALAVEHGAATDEVTAVREQLLAFRQRVENRQNDLGPDATRENWERLLAAAKARQVEIDAGTVALAQAEPLPPDDGRVRRVFEGLSNAELKQKLADPVQRIEAIRELCARRHASAIESAWSVLDTLRPNEVAVAMAQLLAFGDAVGDRLIEALGSPNEAVRQCAALALGKLQLRRAIVPLLERLEAEELPIHAELARAFGDLGGAALRSVVRVIPTATRPDRLVLALAHLANHGSAREVEKLENDPDAEVAQAARKAMARRARMEWEDLSVREQRTLTDASPAARLSQAFYAEATKVAI